jgi:CheY-like chemotaxis protein
MRRVRALLLTTLEQLNPGAGAPFRSPQARAYSVLKLHYVERLTILEVAHELAISERTIYRELRKAEHDLAVLLLGSHLSSEAARAASQPFKTDDEPVLREAKRIEGNVQNVEVCLLLQGILGAVGRLSELRQVSIISWLPDTVGESPTISADPLLLRQMLINALSHLIQNSEPGASVTVRVDPEPNNTSIRISCVPAPLLSEKDFLPRAARQLLQRMNALWSASIESDGCLQVNLQVGGHSPFVILVIDDNQNLIELFRRYLADEGYAILGASDGKTGLQLAIEHTPNLVILDVMMPQHDGWEVLQWFQSGESTSNIPVIICSVLNDPELAFSLGAAGFIPKPVARQGLLSALSRYQRDDE